MARRRLHFGRRGLRRPDRLLAAACLGAMAAAGQAPLGFWWLTLPALWLLTWLVTLPEDTRGTAALGWAAGAGYFAASMFWIMDPFYVDPARDGWMAPFALVGMAGGMAIFWGLAGALAGWLGGRDRTGRALGFAVGLAFTGLLRSYVLTGLPWALVGHVWVGTWVAQADAVVGPIGLSMLTTLAAAAPVAFGLVRGGLLVWALLGSAVAFGGWRLRQPDPPARPQIVRLVQPNAAQSLKWRPDMAPVFFRRLLAETEAPGKRDLTIWPETSVPFLLNRAGAGLGIIAEAGQGAPVALGIQRTEGFRAYNSLAVIQPDGRVGAVYDKHHLVPFGEYIPLGNLFYDLTGVPTYAPSQGYGYSPGPGPQVLDLGALGHVLPLICYEGIFPQDLRTGRRPDWIVQITDDGWFGTLAGPYQHLAQVRLRAIGQGLPILRVANTGVTAVIDAKGRVLKSLPLDTQGHIDTAIPGALAPTPYSRTGDWPMLEILLAAGAGIVSRRRRLGH
ncbi:MAG: apolipoprotein N-acyltransferase [Paracoccaceae bacterium]|nr:apolipoprotein N-acyltransferase [Paracoccaceae bacterium]